MSAKTPVIEPVSSEVVERRRYLKRVHDLLAGKLTSPREQKSLQKLVIYCNHRLREFVPRDSISQDSKSKCNLDQCQKCHCDDLTDFQIRKIGKRKRVELRKKCTFCGHFAPPIALERQAKTADQVDGSNKSSPKKTDSLHARAIPTKVETIKTSRNTFTPGGQNLQKLMSSRKKLNKDTGLLDFLMKSNSKK